MTRDALSTAGMPSARALAVIIAAAACFGTAAAATSTRGSAPVAAASAPAASGAHGMASMKPMKTGPTIPKKLIDINSASKAQLKTLPGIGDAEAARIIAGRPYLTKADLVTAKAIPTGTYLSIKRSIVALQPGKPAVKGKS